LGKFKTNNKAASNKSLTAIMLAQSCLTKVSPLLRLAASVSGKHNNFKIVL